MIQESKGMCLGSYEKFIGKESQLSWNVEDKMLFFSNSILNCNLKSQNSLVSVSSLKLLLSSKLNEPNFSLQQFVADLGAKVDLNQQVIFSLISRQNLE